MDFERKQEFVRPPEITEDKHWAWILLVMAGSNAANAARKVGYKETSAKSQGYVLKKRYKEVLEKLMAEEMEYLESNAHRILAATAALAYSSVDNYIDVIDVVIPAVLDEEGNEIEPEKNTQVIRFKPWDTIDPADKAAIKRIDMNGDGSIKLWLHDKVKPLELLGQHENLWGKEAGDKTVVHLNNHYGPEAPAFPTNVG